MDKEADNSSSSKDASYDSSPELSNEEDTYKCIDIKEVKELMSNTIDNVKAVTSVSI